MLSNLSKFILFLLSYSPLLLFIIYHNLSNCIIILICIGIFLTLVLMSYLLINRVKKYNSQNIVASNIKMPSKEAITLHTVIYILPFATMNFSASRENIASFLIMGTILLIVGYSFIKYRLIHINPILAIIFRYSIYEIETNKSSIFLLSKRSFDTLKSEESLDIIQIADILYLDASSWLPSTVLP